MGKKSAMKMESSLKRIHLAMTVVAILWFTVAPPIEAAIPEIIGIIKSDTINTGFGKRIMPLGDQNGDGYDDVLVADLLGRAYLYYGTTSLDTVVSYQLKFKEVTYRMNDIGDVNGDGFDDFILPRYVGGTGKLDLYYGGPLMDTVPDMWFGLDSLYGIGYSSIGFDINGTGTPKVVTLSNDVDAALFYELSQPPDSIHDFRLAPANLQVRVDYDNFAYSPVVGFFNGDREPDLALGLLRHLGSGVRGAVYFYWGGSTFDTIPDLIVDRPGGYVLGSEYFGAEVLEYAGDLNGDGFDDLFASSGSAIDDSLGFIFFGGPALDSIPEVVISNWHTVARCAGDVNHDGFADLITGNPLPFSGLGDVRVYYGGPAMDSIPDITFTAAGMPGYQVEFGLDCSGVGDFNGDGLDDFAFSYKNGYGYGIVLIYSGTDANSVDYEYDPALPADYTLSQNFPNPLNATTQIRFSLPRRSLIKLTVVDVLGRRVESLAIGEYKAGTYTATWNAEKTSSGVYFCVLEAIGVKLTQKMVLLK